MRTTTTDGTRPLDPTLALVQGATRAIVRPDEGGVADELIVAGRSVLARSPWRDRVLPSAEPAADEAEWVGRWRGGWQLCFPTSGDADPVAAPTQGFHGAASQAPWRVTRAGLAWVELHWTDAAGLTAERAWRALDDGLTVTTTAINRGERPRILAIAEHLVLGGDLLAPIFEVAPLRIDAPTSAYLAPLDYAGAPAGPPLPWPGPISDTWETIDARTPARVAALVDPAPRIVRIVGPEVTATVRWEGLPHALLWEELAQSDDPPWLGAVTALGIEPTSTPHGAGTASGLGLIELAPAAAITWTVELRITTTTNTTTTHTREERS
ncbi:MAG: hypothetical protein ACXWZG_02555 [Microbacterium sp.]